MQETEIVKLKETSVIFLLGKYQPTQQRVLSLPKLLLNVFPGGSIDAQENSSTNAHPLLFLQHAPDEVLSFNKWHPLRSTLYADSGTDMFRSAANMQNSKKRHWSKFDCHKQKDLSILTYLGCQNEERKTTIRVAWYLAEIELILRYKEEELGDMTANILLS